jgi:hypothetical protein
MEIFDFQSDCGMAPGAAMLLGSCAAPKPPGFIVAPMLFVPFLISFAIFLPRSFRHKKRKKEEGHLPIFIFLPVAASIVRYPSPKHQNDEKKEDAKAQT